LPLRHKDTKGHKDDFFFILKTKFLCVSLCLGALVPWCPGGQNEAGDLGRHAAEKKIKKIKKYT
jgi:hypothetical protein